MLTVLCCVSSNSRCAIELGIECRMGCRSKTWKLGFSSAQTTQKPRRANRSAWRSTEDLLGTLLEVSVDARRPPIPRAMRLEVHLIEDRLDRPIADGRDDPIFDRWRQILARPVGDVQALGDWLQAGQ